MTFEHYDDLRNTADLTLLLTSDSAMNNACGIRRLNSLRQTSAVSKKSCVSQFTPAHEIGHNFGMHHNREIPLGSAPESLPYSYGFLIQPPGATLTDGYRTILA